MTTHTRAPAPPVLVAHPSALGGWSARCPWCDGHHVWPHRGEQLCPRTCHRVTVTTDLESEDTA